jgi:hypothetical protein
LIVTTTTSWFAAKLVPSKAELVPDIRSPPWIQNMTALALQLGWAGA